jgi:hypothetical protein
MLNFENALTFKAGEEPIAALRNFWAPEGAWVWSTGHWSEITFVFDVGSRPATGIAELIVDLDVYKEGDILPGQDVLVYLNGLRIGSLYCSHRMTIVCVFDASLLSKTENILTFDTPQSAKPSDFGSADGRLLGIQLFSVQIRKAG